MPLWTSSLIQNTHAQAHHQESLPFTLCPRYVGHLVAPGCLKLHVLCSAIVAIYNANQDARLNRYTYDSQGAV